MIRKISVMGTGGHTETLWRSDVDVKDGEKLAKGEVDEAQARKVFNALMAKKMAPFEVIAGIGENELTTFKPDAEEILFVAPIVGG